jgi:hypothetical protein
MIHIQKVITTTPQTADPPHVAPFTPNWRENIIVRPIPRAIKEKLQRFRYLRRERHAKTTCEEDMRRGHAKTTCEDDMRRGEERREEEYTYITLQVRTKTVSSNGIELSTKVIG